MALILTMNNAQSEFVNTGFLFQNTYYVDDKLTDGLEFATFCTVESGESKCHQISKKQAVLVPSGKDIKKKASGIVYTTSPRDPYGRLDDFTNETRLYPYGYRQDQAIGLLKKGVIFVNSTTEGKRYREWRTHDVDLGTGTVSGNNTLTLDVGTKELKYGSKILFNNSTIGYVTGVTNETTYTVQGLTDAATKNVKVLCQMDDPLYLNTSVTLTAEDKGIFEDGSKLPFTPVPPVSGELHQVVGYIESPIAARIDLTMHIDPIVLG